MPNIFHIANVISGSVPSLKVGHSNGKLTSITVMTMTYIGIDLIINQIETLLYNIVRKLTIVKIAGNRYGK